MGRLRCFDRGFANVRNRRKLDVPGDQGEPAGGVETGLRRLHRIKTPLFDFKRDFAALLAEIVGIRAWQERPTPVRIT
jgi:hypothetical protein